MSWPFSCRLMGFSNGNKRAVRMVEDISLTNVDIIPVYPVKDSDILNYRKGLIVFYEMEDYSLYIDHFLDGQIERIKEVE